MLSHQQQWCTSFWMTRIQQERSPLTQTEQQESNNVKEKETSLCARVCVKQRGFKFTMQFYWWNTLIKKTAEEERDKLNLTLALSDRRQCFWDILKTEGSMWHICFLWISCWLQTKCHTVGGWLQRSWDAINMLIVVVWCVFPLWCIFSFVMFLAILPME